MIGILIFLVIIVTFFGTVVLADITAKSPSWYIDFLFLALWTVAIASWRFLADLAANKDAKRPLEAERASRLPMEPYIEPKPKLVRNSVGCFDRLDNDTKGLLIRMYQKRNDLNHDEARVGLERSDVLTAQILKLLEREADETRYD